MVAVHLKTAVLLADLYGEASCRTAWRAPYFCSGPCHFLRQQTSGAGRPCQVRAGQSPASAPAVRSPACKQSHESAALGRPPSRGKHQNRLAGRAAAPSTQGTAQMLAAVVPPAPGASLFGCLLEPGWRGACQEPRTCLERLKGAGLLQWHLGQGPQPEASHGSRSEHACSCAARQAHVCRSGQGASWQSTDICSARPRSEETGSNLAADAEARAGCVQRSTVYTSPPPTGSLCGLPVSQHALLWLAL